MAEQKFFFVIFILTSYSIHLINTLPQATSELDCAEGESWVEYIKCDIDVGEAVSNISIRKTGIDDLEDKVCCPKKNIKVEVKPSQKICSDFEGFGCISLEKCLAERSSLDDDNGQINPADIKCPNDFETCCSLKDLKPETNESPTTTPVSTTVPTNQPVYAARCGRHNKDGASKIKIANPVDGETATQFGEWPHMCIVFKLKNDATKRGEANTFLGGASLIAPGLVLTAAHEVYNLDPSEISVRCGEWDLNSRKEPFLHQDRAVRKITIHPSFNLPLVLNDFALLHLTQEFDLSPHIDTICLPENPKNAAESEYNSSDCHAMGWGKHQHGNGGYFQPNLKQVHLPIADRKNCQAKLRQTPQVTDTFVLESSLLCAGGEKDKDTCEGDGGGPLVCRALDDKERFIQVGIVAAGVECGMPDVPGLYASVADGLCFIDWAMKCENGDKYNKFVKIKGCQNWIDDELARLKGRERLYAKRNPARMTEGQKRVTMRDLTAVKDYIVKTESLKASCPQQNPSSGNDAISISQIGARKPVLE